MAKAGELDWTDLMSGKVGEPEHPLSKPLNGEPNKGGEKVTKEELKKEAEFIIKGWQQPGIKSPNKEEAEAFIKSIFPQLAWTEEEWKKAEEQWNNRVNDNFNRLKKATVQEKPDDLKDWGNSKSFNDSLSREEQLQRNMCVDE